MKIEFKDLKSALFVVGLGLMVVATTILYIAYKLISTGAIPAIIGIAFLMYYSIIGTIGGVLLIFGRTPTPKLMYLLPAILLAQAILLYLTSAYMVLTLPSLIIFVPPVLIVAKMGAWATGKGTIKDKHAFRFFKKL
ncbi:MAG TPA: hypothetical protein ENG66_06585 [Thermococcus sp.]|nr:MAG: hypothetical protein DRP04_07930 [Archaeoglobales archaeon]HDH45037.1 hypothetical protein [Thermococcus sp.]